MNRQFSSGGGGVQMCNVPGGNGNGNPIQIPCHYCFTFDVSGNIERPESFGDDGNSIKSGQKLSGQNDQTTLGPQSPQQNNLIQKQSPQKNNSIQAEQESSRKIQIGGQPTSGQNILIKFGQQPPQQNNPTSPKPLQQNNPIQLDQPTNVQNGQIPQHQQIRQQNNQGQFSQQYPGQNNPSQLGQQYPGQNNQSQSGQQYPGKNNQSQCGQCPGKKDQSQFGQQYPGKNNQSQCGQCPGKKDQSQFGQQYPGKNNQSQRGQQYPGKNNQIQFGQQSCQQNNSKNSAAGGDNQCRLPDQSQQRSIQYRIGQAQNRCCRPDTPVYLCRNTKTELSKPQRTPAQNGLTDQTKATRRSKCPAPTGLQNGSSNQGQGNQAVTIFPAYFQPCYGFGDANEIKKFYESRNQPSKPLPGKKGNKSRGRERKGRGDQDSNKQRENQNCAIDDDNWVQFCTYAPAPVNTLRKGKGKKGEPEALADTLRKGKGKKEELEQRPKWCK